MRKRILLSVMLLPACTSVETLRPDVEARTPPSRLEEIAYINTLREAFTRGEVERCYRGDDQYFRAGLSQGYREHSRAQEGLSENAQADDARAASNCLVYADPPEPARIRRYLEAGYGLSDLYCQRFFIVASQAALRRRFERNVGNTADSLIGTILSLATGGETAIGIVNAGFGAIDSSFQNADESFLVAPDLENVRALVHASQDGYRQETLTGERMPQSYQAARSAIERYAGICSYTGMRRLVNVSVAEQTAQLQERTDQPQPQQPPAQAQQLPERLQAVEDRPAASTPPPPSPQP